MNDQILRLLKNTWGLLIFALLSGGAYFVIVLRFVIMNTNNGSGLIAYFFAPAVICGAALIIVKIVKQCLSDGRTGAALALFWAHAAFIAMSAVILTGIFIN